MSDGYQMMDARARVHLNILGSFDLRMNGQPLPASISHASKLRSILCYLILFRERAVTHQELIEAFYEDENQRDPAGALKMQILRIKKALSPLLSSAETPILSRRGSYQWNPALTCWVDAEAFEHLCAEAEHPETADEKRTTLYRQAVLLYQGESVLEKDGLLWSRMLNSRYQAKYIAAVEKYAELLSASGNYPEMEATCLRAIEKNQAVEKLYILLIQALLKQKKHTEARTYYKNIVDILFKDLGVRPSKELQQLYAQCACEEKPWEQDLSLVMEDMRAPTGKREAFYCGFEQFKNIYQLEVRRAQRNGGCLHVAMLTVTGTDGKVLGTGVNNVIMERVRHAIVSHLRQSDVVARYSNCQFIIMLPYANLEDSYMVMDRIVNAYKARNPHNTIRFTYQIRELEMIL